MEYAAGVFRITTAGFAVSETPAVGFQGKMTMKINKV